MGPLEDETAFVLAGQGMMILDGRSVPVSAQSCVTIPSGTAHSVHNTGDQPLDILAMHNPPTR